MGMVNTNELDTIRAPSHRTSLQRKTVFFKKKTLLLTAFLFLFQTPYSNNVYAQGVAAGTDIGNKVIVNYQIAGKQQEPLESSPTGNSIAGIGKGQPTVFKVDRKIDLLVTANSNANVTPGDKQAEVTYTLTNEGNDIQEFSFILETALPADNFDTNNCSIVINTVTGTLLSGVVIPTSGNIKLSADQQASISVKCDIPIDHLGQPVLKGDISLLSLYATAEKNADGSSVQESTTADTALGIETVFTDNAGTDDGDRDASHTARTTYTIADVETPALSIDKSIVNTVDPEGSSKAVSGAVVTYRIAITTTGTGSIDNTIITDPTPTGMTYKTGSISLNNNPLTDNSDTDKADFGITNINTATINLGNITAGSLDEIQLSYTIN